MIDPGDMNQLAAEAGKQALEDEKKRQAADGSGTLADVADVAGDVLSGGVGEMVAGAVGAVVEGAGAVIGGVVEITGAILGGLLDS